LLNDTFNSLQYQKKRDLTKKMEEKKNKNSGNGFALGACFGLVFGSAFGIVFGDISTGVDLGYPLVKELVPFSTLQKIEHKPNSCPTSRSDS
jgi:hypothetical protein